MKKRCLLVPKLCLSTLNTEAPASGIEAELQKTGFPSGVWEPDQGSPRIGTRRAVPGIPQ
ncbi:MAG: hypothetical protein D3909_14480 [Candidatus Electrothrix sp. ATG1]|nr:hypothetical protein [Candidatus Electrothrix sp. ATG1]MCI5207975.1 hypothetical protein [Candidatus Electrothrix sp. ATG2]